MDGRIGRLNCRYLVAAPSAEAELVTRLDRVARDLLADSLMTALNCALAHDSTVYVMRKIKAELVLDSESFTADTQIAAQWGESLARAVTRTIARDRSDATNLVTFASEADYTAHFIDDLIAGTAWDRWFYSPFFRLRNFSLPIALQKALTESKDQIPVVLKHLNARGVMQDVCSVLGPQGAEFVWQELAEKDPALPDALRPLFHLATDLMIRLDFEFSESPNIDSLLRSFTSRNSAQVDWRDSTGLAIALWTIVTHVIGSGVVQPPLTQPAELWLPRITTALTAFDWLDRAYLEQTLLQFLSGEERKGQSPNADRLQSPTPSADDTATAAGDTNPQTSLDSVVADGGAHPYPSPHRAEGIATPRQQRLLGDLLDAVQACRGSLDVHQFDSSRNALQLYACLLNRHPEWSSDSGVAPTIRSFLAAVRTFRDERGGTAISIETSKPLLRTAPVSHTPMGQALVKMARSLAIDDQDISARRAAIPTECAGLFLLIRALNDLGLPGLTESPPYPATELSLPFPAVMLGLGICCTGPSAIQCGRLDAGLALLSGLDIPPEVEKLREVWNGTTPLDHIRFQASLLRALANQRVAGSSTIHILKVPLGASDWALVAADELMGSGLLGRQLTPNLNVESVVASWIEAWKDTFGEQPHTVVVDEEFAQQIGSQFAGIDVLVVPETRSHEFSVDAGKTHHQVRDGLTRSLTALFHRLLDNPEAELSLALIAIAVLRTWARWLRRFESSSVPYLLDSFIRRRGRIFSRLDAVIVEVESRPLDIVLEMAGYTSDLQSVTWLGHRRVHMEKKGA
jgi:hypothetical protein